MPFAGTVAQKGIMSATHFWKLAGREALVRSCRIERKNAEPFVFDHSWNPRHVRGPARQIPKMAKFVKPNLREAVSCCAAGYYDHIIII